MRCCMGDPHGQNSREASSQQFSRKRIFSPTAYAKLNPPQERCEWTWKQMVCHRAYRCYIYVAHSHVCLYPHSHIIYIILYIIYIYDAYMCTHTHHWSLCFLQQYVSERVMCIGITSFREEGLRFRISTNLSSVADATYSVWKDCTGRHLPKKKSVHTRVSKLNECWQICV